MSKDWNGAGAVSSCKTEIRVSYVTNIKATEGLATPGDKASAAENLLTPEPRCRQACY